MLINLMHIGRLDLLGALVKYRFVVCDVVKAEIVDPVQRESLEAAITVGGLEEVATDSLAESELYRTFKRKLDPGEAGALALAVTHHWDFATDEGPATKLAREHLGAHRLMNTVGLMVEAIRAGAISIAEADQMKAVLEASRFKMRFSSFQEII